MYLFLSIFFHVSNDSAKRYRLPGDIICDVKFVKICHVGIFSTYFAVTQSLDMISVGA